MFKYAIDDLANLVLLVLKKLFNQGQISLAV